MGDASAVLEPQPLAVFARGARFAEMGELGHADAEDVAPAAGHVGAARASLAIALAFARTAFASFHLGVVNAQ